MKQFYLSTVVFGGLMLCCAGAVLADNSLTLAFNPDRTVPEVAHVIPGEDCYVDAGLARGTLGPATADGNCHSGLIGKGYAGVTTPEQEIDVAVAAEFTSESFGEGLALLGPAFITVYPAFEPIGASGGPFDDLQPGLGYVLQEIRPDGTVIWIAYGTAIEHFNNNGLGSPPPANTGTFDFGPYMVAAGSRLRLQLYSDPVELPSCDDTEPVLPPQCLPPPPPSSHPAAAEVRLLYGGGTFGDSGISLTIRDPESKTLASDMPGGSLPMTLLIPLIAGAFVRRQRQRLALGGLLLSCAVTLAFLLLGDTNGPSTGKRAGLRAAVGEVSIDPEWARLLAERPRDRTGLTGSGVISRFHGGDSPSASKKGSHESRLFRTGHPGIEPTLGVTRNGWIFYIAIVAGVGEGVQESLVIRSKDGGASWEALAAPRQNQDPYLWVDPATDRIFWTDFLGCGLLSYSDDYGETWTDAPPVGCGHHTDHQTLYAGPPVSSTTIDYPNVIYYCSMGGGAFGSSSTEIACSRSLDGGITFLPTVTPPFPPIPTGNVGIAINTVPGFCGGGSGHIFVAADGAVYVPRGVCGQPWLAISRDEGTTWTRVQVSDNGMGRDVHGGWDHEAAVRADGQGNVFYSWVARDRIPYLAVSRDGGLTWGAPIRIAPPEVKEADLPNMDMDEAGRLAFVYMGSTDSPGTPFPNDGGCEIENQIDAALEGEDCGLVEAKSVYAKVTWSGFITITDNPLQSRPDFESATVSTGDDPLIRGECGPGRCQAEYDFIDVEFGPAGEIVAAMIDGCEIGGCTNPGEAVLGALVKAAVGPPLPAQPALSEFVADGELPLRFTPDPARTTGVTSPEGCETEAGAPIGSLAPPGFGGVCHSAPWGWAGYVSETPAEFTSGTLAELIALGGAAGIVVHLADPLRSLEDSVSEGFFIYVFDEVSPDGSAILLSSGETLHGADDGRNSGTFNVAPHEVAAGNRLRLRLSYANPGPTTTAARMLFGGESYGDAGITLTYGHFEQQKGGVAEKTDAAPEGRGLLMGALSPAVLLVLAGLLACKWWIDRRSGQASRR